ncbi:MAG: type II toxin-antitoxin system VapC family toxin [Acidimicrobiales bacterium]
MRLPVVLDADGLDALVSQRPPDRLRALLAEAWRHDRDVVVPAVICAEVCRGTARTRAVESALSRRSLASAPRPAVQIIPTDFDVARRVGAVLHRSGASSAEIVDAHVVAIAASFGGALVVTSDPGDIGRLAGAVPTARIVTRPAR